MNNFIPDTFLDDGSKGVDDQFIKSGLARLTWQVSPRNKLSLYFDEVDKFRGHDMQALFDPETAATVWYSPAYHTTSAKWMSTVTSRLLIEGGWSNNTENYTNVICPASNRRGAPTPGSRERRGRSWIWAVAKPPRPRRPPRVRYGLP